MSKNHDDGRVGVQPPPGDFGGAGKGIGLDTGELAALLIQDPARSAPFRPWLTLDPAKARSGGAPPLSPALVPEGIPSLVRHARRQAFADRVAGGWHGPRLLVDGDSWLQFPLVSDLAAQLDHDHALDCLAHDGDALQNPLRARQIGECLIESRPDAVLLSVGGGDAFNGFRLPAFVEPFAQTRRARDYPTPYFVATLQHELMPNILTLLSGIRSIDARVPIVLHSYAYARPRDHIWLGRPLADLGIRDPELQRQVVAALVDRFYTALVHGIAIAGLGNVHVVDCRDAVGANWFDELHPNNRGFEAIAERFRATLARFV